MNYFGIVKNPHEIAGEVSFVLRQWEGNRAELQLELVRDLLDNALHVLSSAPDIHDAVEWFAANANNPGFVETTQHDFLACSAGNPQQRAAGALAVTCCEVIRRGKLDERDHRSIPMNLAALAGFVPDRNKAAARKPRPKRSEEDALDRGLDESLTANPDHDWANHAGWLETEGVVTAWDVDRLSFTDGETEREISIGTFLNRITRAKKRRESKTYHA